MCHAFLATAFSTIMCSLVCVCVCLCVCVCVCVSNIWQFDLFQSVALFTFSPSSSCRFTTVAGDVTVIWALSYGGIQISSPALWITHALV